MSRMPRFYESMAKVGIVYGPEFQGLADVTASPTEQVAIGHIIDPNNHRGAPLHAAPCCHRFSP